MKSILLSSVLPLLAATASAQAPDIIHYTFENSDATNSAVPGVGNGLANSEITFGPGICGNVAAIAGAGVNQIDSGWQVDFGTGSWTIGMWIDLSVGGNGFQYFYGSSSTGGLRCFCNGAAGVDNVMLRTLSAVGDDVILTGGAPNTGPTHCAWVYDASTTTVFGYVNGALVATVLQTNALNINGTSADFNVMAYTTSDMVAGNRMDDFRVYRRAISAAEVADWASNCGVGGTLGTNYCTANPNSTGVAGEIAANGSSVASDNNVTLMASNMPTGQFGIFVTSKTQDFVPNVGSGNLCVGGVIGRYQQPGQIQQIDANGQFSYTIDTTLMPQGASLVPILPGETWNFQAWHRDFTTTPPITNTSNLTNAVEITFS